MADGDAEDGVDLSDGAHDVPVVMDADADGRREADGHDGVDARRKSHGRGRAPTTLSAEQTGGVRLDGTTGINVVVTGIANGGIYVFNWAGLPLLIVAVVLPSCALLAFDWIRRSPGLAVLLLIAYWITLAVGAFLMSVMAQRFAAVSPAVDAVLGRAFSRFHSRYRDWILQRNRYPQPARPLLTSGPLNPELDAVFVDVSLVPRPSHQIGGGLLADALVSAAERYSIWHFLGRREPRVIVVLGAPGSGKSTLLRHVTRRIARRASLPWQRSIPVLIELRTHGHRLAADPTVTLPEAVATMTSGCPGVAPDGWWASNLRRGRCVVMFDGLDEVTEAVDRAAILRWLTEQIASYAANDFVLTSRPYGYDRVRVDAALTLQVRPFTEEQAYTFIRLWYGETERAECPDRRQANARATAGATDLIVRLSSAPSLRDLMVNPLLLTMIANVHRHRGALPGNRVQLYHELFEILLAPRDEPDPVRAALIAKGRRDATARVAFTFMTREISSLSRTDIECIPRESGDSALDLDKLTADGIMIEREPGRYAFAHLTLLEYLTAQHLLRTGDPSVLIAGVDRTWWRETTLLWAAEAGTAVEEVVRACLRSGTAAALALAFECADVGNAVGGPVGSWVGEASRAMLQRFVDAAHAPDAQPEQRRVAACVEALRYLRQSNPTDRSGRLCVKPVPAGLYWFFIADGGPAPAADRSPPTDRAEPARGMWATDAQQFVAWINQITRAAGDPDASYRLPTRQELESAPTYTAPAEAAGQITTHAWATADPTTLPRLWIRNGEPDPAVLTGKEIWAAASVPSTDQHVLLPTLALGLRARVIVLDHLARAMVQRTQRNHDYLWRAGRGWRQTRLQVMNPFAAPSAYRFERVAGHRLGDAFTEEIDLATDAHRGATRLGEALTTLGQLLERTRLGTGRTPSDLRSALNADKALKDLCIGCAQLWPKIASDQYTQMTSHSDRTALRAELRHAVTALKQLRAQIHAAAQTISSTPTTDATSWSQSVEIPVGADDLFRPVEVEKSVVLLLRQTVGAGLAEAWSAMSADPDKEDTAVRSAFVTKLLQPLSLSRDSRKAVDLDAIVRQVATETVRNGDRLPPWARALADVVTTTGVPMLTRAAPPGLGTAQAVTMCAIAIAAGMGGEARDRYLSIALASMLFRRRFQFAPETIILVQV